MGRQSDDRFGHALAGILTPQIRVRDLTCVTAGPTVGGTASQDVDGVRERVVPQVVPTVVGGPDLPRPGVDGQSNRIPQSGTESPVAGTESPVAGTVQGVLDDRGPSRIALHATVATGTDRDVKLIVRHQDDLCGMTGMREVWDQHFVFGGVPQGEPGNPVGFPTFSPVQARTHTWWTRIGPYSGDRELGFLDLRCGSGTLSYSLIK